MAAGEEQNPGREGNWSSLHKSIAESLPKRQIEYQRTGSGSGSSSNGGSSRRGKDDGSTYGYSSDCEVGPEQPLLSSTVAAMAAKKRGDRRAPLVILAFECLESTAFFGVSTNLVMYLTTVVHESNSSSISSVTAWTGTSYLTPLLGAFLADTVLGSYNTTLFSVIIYLIGLVILTLSALLPSTVLKGTANLSSPTAGLLLQPPSPSAAQSLLLYTGLYLVALGSGGVKSSLLPLGADQYDEGDQEQQEQQEGAHIIDKPAFFSWFYVCISVGSLVSGTVLVWVQQNISWVLGYGLATSCLAFAFVAFLLASPLFLRRDPRGSPLKSLAQVIVASITKGRVQVPRDAGLLYEVDLPSTTEPAETNRTRKQLAHTDQFRFFDKAAVVVEQGLEGKPTTGSSSWRLCTVTQVEELKMLLRTLPLWLTSVVYSIAYAQMGTTFIEQGNAMDTTLSAGGISVSIPPAMLPAVEVLFIVAWTLFYDNIAVPTARRYTGNPRGLSLLQRMGVGRFLMILSMLVAALVENIRLVRASTTPLVSMSILWQLPQYFLVGGSEALNYIAQLEFFYEMSPDSMKSMSTAFYLLSISAGSYASSFLVSLVQGLTATGGRPGWIPDDLNNGHLDYYYYTLAAMCALNFIAHIACSRIYMLSKLAP